MRKFVVATIFVLIMLPQVISAQEGCDFDPSTIIQRVSEACSNLNENEVCYGNEDVGLIPSLEAGFITFSSPGDTTALLNVQSLFLSSYQELADDQTQWGIAQMSLEVPSPDGLQRITMLLFGDTELENAAPDRDPLDVRVIVRAGNLYPVPSVASTPLATYDIDTVLQAVGRLSDSSWVRVENNATGYVGWMPSTSVRLVNSAQSLGSLRVEQEDEPYYGAMQAFYFNNNDSFVTGNCTDVASDGLLIQTPEGQARVSLLVNEVSVDLQSVERTEDDTAAGSVAFFQANPQSNEGMSIDLVAGQATIETEAGSAQLGTGERSTISLQFGGSLTDVQSVGAPSEPLSGEINPSIGNLAPALPQPLPQGSAVTAPNVAIGGNNTANNGGNGTGGVDVNVQGNITGTNNNGGSTNGSNADNGSSGSTTGSTNSGGNGSNGGITLGGNDTEQTNTTERRTPIPPLPTAVPNTQPRQENFFEAQGNVIALTLVVTLGVLFLGWLIYSAWRTSDVEEL